MQEQGRGGAIGHQAQFRRAGCLEKQRNCRQHAEHEHGHKKVQHQTFHQRVPVETVKGTDTADGKDPQTRKDKRSAQQSTDDFLRRRILGGLFQSQKRVAHSLAVKPFQPKADQQKDQNIGDRAHFLCVRQLICPDFRQNGRHLRQDLPCQHQRLRAIGNPRHLRVDLFAQGLALLFRQTAIGIGAFGDPVLHGRIPKQAQKLLYIIG